MRLREENKLKDKVEIQLETRHMFYVVLWSIVLSGIIFATGLFVGQKKQEGVNGFTLGNELKLKEKSPVVQEQDPLSASFSFIETLDKHPEKRELKDAVLNAMAKLRLETLHKVRAEEEVLKKDLARKLFKDRLAAAEKGRADEEIDPLEPPERLLARGQGVKARRSHSPDRLGQAPEFPEEEIELKADPLRKSAVRNPDPPAPVAIKEELGQPLADEFDDGVNLGGLDGKIYAVQAKAFREKDDAMIFMGYIKKELRRSKYKAFIMPVELPGKGKWYRVRIGKFPSRLEAEKFKSGFEKRLGLETFLVTL
jgi:DedD protein